MRPAFLLAVARPCSRRISMAFSKSPSAWVRAFLHSIMPQSVWRRSSITSFAEIAMFLLSFLSCTRVCLRSGFGALRSGGSGFFLNALLAFQHGVRHGAGDQLDGADGVVVAGDHVIDL